MLSEVEPIPLDDPHWDGDEIYAAMTLEEKLGLCHLVAWKRKEEAERAAHPPEPSIEVRVLRVLESIDQKLAVLVSVARERG